MQRCRINGEKIKASYGSLSNFSKLFFPTNYDLMYPRVRRWVHTPINTRKLMLYRIPRKYWVLSDIKPEEVKDVEIIEENYYVVNLTKARIIYKNSESELPLHEFYGWKSEHSFNKTTHRPIKGSSILAKNNAMLLYVVEEQRPKTLMEELFGTNGKGGINVK